MNGIIDAHTHIWSRSSGDYGWITPDLPALEKDFRLGDVLDEAGALGVERFVLVQAADTAGDTDRMLAEAAAHRQVAGVVAWLPLGRPELSHALADRLATGRVVGVRALIHDMADTDWVLRPEVADGLDAVADAGLPFDLVTAGPAALALVPRLTARHPSLRLIIDHLGKPPIRGTAEGLAQWRRLMRAAAESRNVAAKLSGLASAVGAADSWTVDDLRPVIDDALDILGPDRLMFGGDWPVCLLAGGYTRTFEGIQAVLDVGVPERERIMRGTATEWYGLGDVVADHPQQGSD